MGMGSIVSILSQSTWGWWVLSVVWGVRWCECLSLNIICTGIIYSIIHFHLICSEMINYPRLQAAIALSGSILIINEPLYPRITSWDGFWGSFDMYPTHLCIYMDKPLYGLVSCIIGPDSCDPLGIASSYQCLFCIQRSCFPTFKSLVMGSK